MSKDKLDFCEICQEDYDTRPDRHGGCEAALPEAPATPSEEELETIEEWNNFAAIPEGLKYGCYPPATTTNSVGEFPFPNNTAIERGYLHGRKAGAFWGLRKGRELGREESMDLGAIRINLMRKSLDETSEEQVDLLLKAEGIDPDDAVKRCDRAFYRAKELVELQSSLEAAKAEAAEANDIMREACAAKAAATKTWNFMFNKQEEKISALTEENGKLKETLRTSSSENEERLTELLGEAKLRLSEMIPVASSYRRLKLGFDTDDIKSAEALLKRLSEGEKK